MVVHTNYHPNGSAENAGTFGTYWGTSGSGTTTTRVTTEHSDGAASAHMVNTGLEAFNGTSTFVDSAITVPLAGRQVWARCKFKGTGTVKDIYLQSFRDDFGANNNVSTHLPTVAASFTELVLGPVTVIASPGRLALSFSNDGSTNGTGAYDIYVDEVMFTNYNPTGATYFDGSRTIGNPYINFQLRPY